MLALAIILATDPSDLELVDSSAAVDKPSFTAPDTKDSPISLASPSVNVLALLRAINVAPAPTPILAVANATEPVVDSAFLTISLLLVIMDFIYPSLSYLISFTFYFHTFSAFRYDTFYRHLQLFCTCFHRHSLDVSNH